MADDNLDELARQFQDAAGALAEAKGKLDGLAGAEKVAADASGSIRSLAKQLEALVAETKEATEALTHTQSASARLLTEAAGVLSGNDLSELRASIVTVESSVADVKQNLDERFTNLQTAIDERMAVVETKLADANQLQEEKAALQAELVHLKANISPRHLKKAQDSFTG